MRKIRHKKTTEDLIAEEAKNSLRRMEVLFPHERFKTVWREDPDPLDNGGFNVVGYKILHKTGFLCWQEVEIPFKTKYGR
jgi:hypothetical protein